ncbi:MAG: glycerol-3-phosphate responsive antiterminator, partial [Lachnospiraceae bacterium]
IDSMALVNIEKQNGSVLPDVIEILPGVMPKIIRKVNGISKVPVVAGGLISDREDVMLALDSGAVAISSTSEKVWFM